MRAHRALVVAALVGILAGTGAAASSAPRWQDVPVKSPDDRTVVWAGGRVWFFNNGTRGGPFTTTSAQVAGGRLSGWVKASRAGTQGWSNLGLHGDGLVFRTSQQGTLQSLPLLPSGKLGEPEDVVGAPLPSSSSGSAVIQLPDRVLQLVDACRYRPVDKPCGEFVSHLGVCCDLNGEVADYASFARPGTRPLARLGLDRRGRLWLAWTQIRQSEPAQIVQLDPQTLKQLGVPIAVPGALFATKIVDLACTETCRLVMQGYKRTRARAPGKVDTNFTWAPGERSLTVIRLPGTTAFVVAARPNRGRLEVAFNFYPRSSDFGGEVALGRGDARGGHFRVLSSISVPRSLGPFERGIHLTLEPAGAFGPGGFVAAAVWENFGGGKATVRATILPVRG